MNAHLITFSDLKSGTMFLKALETGFVGNKNALTGAFRLACLEIRSTNEEAINSTRNRIYSLTLFYILLYRSRYFLFVSELF